MAHATVKTRRTVGGCLQNPDNPEILEGIPMDAMTILTRDQLCAKLLISDTTRQRLEKTDPTFPRKLHVSVRKVGYLVSDVQAYIARQHQKAA
ncbi:AlpA family phage regulatory protein [Mesorhizobium sp. B2-5-7]|uniref:helix-turn-helix transcriptional regulator n=1 Tax=Mesorhizobium sp. B2-5-7 TaxID=2589923 RepID=UPI00112DAED2|nr:AlpA family phage regulatory protein [Mesorhizobium sp. B2-5-7]TPK17739.1 AlpA family phage regulatory protein [Mesorhizobium sp. B2-5-7]